MAFGQFMALLDIQIVAASLNSIQAGTVGRAGRDRLGADRLSDGGDRDDPAGGLSSARRSRRAGCSPRRAVLFTLASLLCGMAWSIQSMTVFRAIQGFVGGAMVPTVFATGFAMFNGKQRAMVPGDPRRGLDARADARPDDRRLDHRYARAGTGCSSSTSCRALFIAIALPILGKVDEPEPRDAQDASTGCTSCRSRCSWAACNTCWRKARAISGSRIPTVTTVAWISFVGALVFFERSLLLDHAGVEAVAVHAGRSSPWRARSTSSSASGFMARPI